MGARPQIVFWVSGAVVTPHLCAGEIRLPFIETRRCCWGAEDVNRLVVEVLDGFPDRRVPLLPAGVLDHPGLGWGAGLLYRGNGVWRVRRRGIVWHTGEALAPSVSGTSASIPMAKVTADDEKVVRIGPVLCEDG